MNVFAYKLPPTFERRTCSDCHRNRIHSSHSSFSRRSFFEPPRRRMVGPECFQGRYRFDSNEVETGKYSGSWLPRIGSTRILFPAFTLPHSRDDWPWEIVSSHSSATAPESHGNSSHRSTTATDKELPPEVA